MLPKQANADISSRITDCSARRVADPKQALHLIHLSHADTAHEPTRPPTSLTCRQSERMPVLQQSGKRLERRTDGLGCCRSRAMPFDKLRACSTPRVGAQSGRGLHAAEASKCRSREIPQSPHRWPYKLHEASNANIQQSGDCIAPPRQGCQSGEKPSMIINSDPRGP